MADDERLVVALEARVSEFERRMRQAENRGTRTYQGLRRGSRSATQQMEQDMIRSTTRINQALATSTSKIGLFAKAFAGGMVGGMAAGAFAGLKGSIDATVKSVASLGNEARRAGIGVEAFQEWKFVAEQNRIGIDALTDGFKELHIRAGEFFLDGTGAGAAAFKKLGYSAEELKRKLEDPSKLMVELLGRLGKLDQAGRSFLLEEIFGGAGGEQFSALIGQGEDALRATIARAHEAGAVLDAELIARAEELDRRFSELTTTVANFGKRLAVSLADAGVELTDFRDRLDEIFSSEAEGRSILGDEVYDTLAANRDMVDENAEALHRLDERYAHLAEEADAAGFAMRNAIGLLDSWGYDELADTLRQASQEMGNLTSEFRDGEVSGEDFAKKLAEIEAAATSAFDQLEAGDRIQFEGVMSQLGRLGGVIASVTSLANSLTSALARAGGVAPDQKASQALRDRHAAEAASMASLKAQREALDGFTAAETARNTATAEQLRLQREIEAVRKRAGEAGLTLSDQEATDFATASLAGEAARQASGKSGRSGGGRGASREKAQPSIFEGAQQRIKELEREIELIGKSAAEVAKAQAAWEMLDEAKKRGIPITDELNAKIDAEAEKIRQLTAERQHLATVSDSVRDSLRGAFDGIFDDPKQALEDLGKQLLELALKMMMVKMFPGTFGAGGLIPLLPGMTDGGYTGDGGRLAPAGVVHKGEYVMDADTVRRAGGPAAFDAMRRSLKKGYSAGGAVGANATPARQGSSAPLVQVIDQRQAGAPPVQTETTRGPDGRDIVRAYITEDVARGRLDKSMGGRFGAKPQRVIR